MEPVDYTMPEVGSDSSFYFSNGNTYPAIARPWGMNFWSPVTTEKNGDGWMYAWRDNRFRGVRQTHQLSPWVNDYGSFLVMPATKRVFSNKDRGARFSHKGEVFKPYYYKIYIGEFDTTLEVTPTERAALMRVTCPETEDAYFIVDAGRVYNAMFAQDPKDQTKTIASATGLAYRMFETLRGGELLESLQRFRPRTRRGSRPPAP